MRCAALICCVTISWFHSDVVAQPSTSQAVPSQDLTWVNYDPTAAANLVLDGLNTPASAALSRDGTKVAFTTWIPHDPSDTGFDTDIYVRDLVSGGFYWVSRGAGGADSNGESRYPTISADGRFVCFTSFASNLAASDGDLNPDIYVHDCVLRTSQLVSAAPPTPNNQFATANYGSISADGSRVAYTGRIEGFSPGTTLSEFHVFVWERLTGSTTVASKSSSGVIGNANSGAAIGDPFGVGSPLGISDDGQVVAFESLATNLAGSLPGWASSLYEHVLSTGITTRVGASASGAAANEQCRFDTFSSDGRFIYFASEATNLVSEATTGSVTYRHDRSTRTVEVFIRNMHGNPSVVSPLFFDSIGDRSFFCGSAFLPEMVYPFPQSLFGLPFLGHIQDRNQGRPRAVTVNAAGQFHGRPDNYVRCYGLSADGRIALFGSDVPNLLPQVPSQGAIGNFEFYTTTGAQLYVKDLGPTRNEGGGLANGSTWPSFLATGYFRGGDPGFLTLQYAPTTQPAVFGFSIGSSPTPYGSGQLIAWPPTGLVEVASSPNGTVVLPYQWPVGVPSGPAFFGQWAVVDPSAPLGIVISNALSVENQL